MIIFLQNAVIWKRIEPLSFAWSWMKYFLSKFVCFHFFMGYWSLGAKIMVRCPHIHFLDSRRISSQRQLRFERSILSLATFIRSHRLLRSLARQRSPLLRLLRSPTPFTGSLTHFTYSLLSWLKIMKMRSRCKSVLRGQSCSLSSLETHPMREVFKNICLW